DWLSYRRGQRMDCRWKLDRWYTGYWYAHEDQCSSQQDGSSTSSGNKEDIIAGDPDPTNRWTKELLYPFTGGASLVQVRLGAHGLSPQAGAMSFTYRRERRLFIYHRLKS